ncbi:MAG: Fe-S cluster assembly protein SufD [Acidobacteriota bacterium]
MKTMDSKTHYLQQFKDVEARTRGAEGSWLSKLRRRAIEDFSEAGFPTTRLEAWKYTNVEPIVASRFKPAAETANGLSPERLSAFTLGTGSGSLLTFVNGRFSKKLSRLGPLPAGVRVESLAAALGNGSLDLEPHLGRHVETSGHPFAALNTAFLDDGALVFIPAGVDLQEPIQIVFATTQAEPAVTYPRVLIVGEKNSRASIVESYVGLGDQAYFTNAVTEIVVQDNATLEHCRMLEEGSRSYHISTVQSHLSRDSNLVSHNYAFGGSLIRNHVNSVLDAEGAESTLFGLYVIADRQHVDNHTRIDHAKPHCSSREIYTGILDDQSRGIFNGRVIVRPDAQKTDAKQTNRNLLLSKEALADTNPELEIYADDVKCTHGATIGQLDEEALFYLRARGISQKAARDILTYAFAGELVDEVKTEPARKYVEKLLRARLPGASGTTVLL